MSSFDIEPGRKLLCQELNTGKDHTGFFYLDDKTISAEICSYDEYLYIQPERPVFLRTENNKIVSLYSNVSAPPDTHSHIIDPKMQSYKQRIISQTAVIGHDRWQQGDQLKRVTFSVKRAKEILKHKEKIERLHTRKIGVPYDADLFAEKVGGMSVRASYAVRYSSDFHAPNDILPIFEIEFHAGATLAEYVEAVNCLVEFFSFSQGAHMKPSDIRISRLSGDELTAKLKAGAHPEDYDVHYIWPETPLEDLDLLAGGSLARAWNDEDLAALGDCVARWMARDADWNKAYVLMMHCLASRNEISGDRLFAASNWFAEIPLTKAEAAITEEHIAAIAETAAETASRLGYGKLKDRIKGALKPIRTETNEERFSRLVNMVKQKFGPTITGDAIVMDLKRAMDFRGKSAHGHFSPADDADLRAFVKSIYAMEALCFLLTACDLPINSAGLSRAQSNPFIRNYRIA
jgi:hypothetical protein